MENGIKVVTLRCLIPLFKTAREATMENGVFSAFNFHAHGLHEPLAGRLAIARIHVNMFAPKALRTMVGVTAPLHKGTAPFAGEVLLGALEFFCHHGFRLLSMLFNYFYCVR